MSDAFSHPILFRHFPDLEKRLDWILLGDFPTPVRKLERLGFDNLWIKNDGLSSAVYGGNKIRKLEFILAAAKSRNVGRVITFGGIGTNHGLATTIFCKRLGLSCTLLLFEQPVTRHVKNNMLLFKKYGADLVFYKSLFSAALAYHTIWRIRHPKACFLFAGGSNPLGTIGFVNAAFELKSQITAGDLPEPAVIFCPAGSNGTLAGLSLGVSLAGLRSRVVGVLVSVARV
jgi:D-cysteine desulfhydrase